MATKVLNSPKTARGGWRRGRRDAARQSDQGQTITLGWTDLDLGRERLGAMKDRNTSSRRQFLRTSGLGLGALPLLSSSCSSSTVDSSRPGSQAGSTTTGASGTSRLAVRKNIADLPLEDPEIKLLQDGIGVLQKRSKVSPLDPSGWQAHAVLHTTFCALSIYSNQVHYNWFVWPWHRLYLWSLEQKLQKAVNEPTLALHYWDWTQSNTIPDHYWGDDNPLNNPGRLVSKSDYIPKDFINVGAGLRAQDFKTFGGYPAIKKRGEAQLDGLAEQSFHNNIHNWIGGQMASFTESGFDPIFYGHHGNCDRIWDAWRAHHPENLLPQDEEWLEKRLFATDGNGRPVDFKVKDLLDTKALGYRFHDLDLNPALCDPFDAGDVPKRNSSNLDCVAPLNIATSQLEEIKKDFSDKERSHVIIHFERAQLPYQPYCARVYLEWDEKSIYTGTFTILPILDLDSFLLQHGVHLQMEVESEIIAAMDQGKKIQVIFQPVPLPNREIPDEILKLENVSILKKHEA